MFKTRKLNKEIACYIKKQSVMHKPNEYWIEEYLRELIKKRLEDDYFKALDTIMQQRHYYFEKIVNNIEKELVDNVETHFKEPIIRNILHKITNGHYCIVENSVQDLNRSIINKISDKLVKILMEDK